MAYADQQSMGANRIVAIIIVVLLHIFLGYALVTGLAFEAIKKAKERLNVVDVKEEKPPEEEPPPPEPDKQIIPPVVSPPPIVRTVSPPPSVTTVREVPPTITLPPRAVPTAPPPPPPPPPPPSAPPSPAVPKNSPGSWATTDDYPSRALSQDREGRTGFRVTIDTEGRVSGCQVTSSSGHADLDDATCKNVTRRARFKPATKDGQPVVGSYSNSVVWRIPK
jgi:periplasmic protein TonB